MSNTPIGDSDAARLMRATRDLFGPKSMATLAQAIARLEFLAGLPLNAIEDALRSWAATNPDEPPNWRQIKNACWKDIRAKAAYARGGAAGRDSYVVALLRRWASEFQCGWAKELVAIHDQSPIDEHALHDWQDANSMIAAYSQQYRCGGWSEDSKAHESRATRAVRLHAHIDSLLVVGPETAATARAWLDRLETDLHAGGYQIPERTGTAGRVSASSSNPTATDAVDKRLF